MTTEEKVKQQHPERVFPERTNEDVVAELLKEKGITEWESLDYGNSEGDVLPGGVYNESGRILTKSGRVYDYWLLWDSEKIAPDGSKGYYSLGENFKDPVTGEPYPLFEEILPGDEGYPKLDDRSFLEAKENLGLV